jgi:hypothetical protein
MAVVYKTLTSWYDPFKMFTSFNLEFKSRCKKRAQKEGIIEYLHLLTLGYGTE